MIIAGGSSIVAPATADVIRSASLLAALTACRAHASSGGRPASDERTSGRSAGSADRLCLPPQVRSRPTRPTTSSARAADNLAAASRSSRAAPWPSAAPRARVDDVLRACWRGRGGARDGGARPPRTRRVAVRGARGRARAGRTRTAAVGSSASACGCPARARVSVACTCTVRRLRGREPRLTFSVGRELAVCGLSLRATVVCT